MAWEEAAWAGRGEWIYFLYFLAEAGLGVQASKGRQAVIKEKHLSSAYCTSGAYWSWKDKNDRESQVWIAQWW